MNRYGMIWIDMNWWWIDDEKLGWYCTKKMGDCWENPSLTHRTIPQLRVWILSSAFQFLQQGQIRRSSLRQLFPNVSIQINVESELTWDKLYITCVKKIA